ncbi:MAG: hypothetical protein IKD22_05845 [Lentisphaeria bacterium]|nr:hypothetical protein [Lentisphaeria bacterium]
MLHGIVDPQPGKFAFALFDDGKKVLEEIREMHGRDAAVIPGIIADTLAAHALDIGTISRWTIGAGPGSFTFLRLVAALVAGWCYGKEEVRFRCVPGAIALAGALKPLPGETIGTIYDGRNKELLYFETICQPDGTLVPSGKSAVFTAAAAAEFFAAYPDLRCAVTTADAAAAAKLLPPEAAVTVVETPDTAFLANSPKEFDNDLDALVYIRPAVFTAPVNS